MSFFSRVSIRAKLIGAFAVLVLTLAGLGLFSVSGLRAVNGQTEEIADKWLPSVKSIGDLTTQAVEFREAVLRRLMNTDDAMTAQLDAEMDKVLGEIKSSRTAYEKLISSEEEQDLYDEFSRQWEFYLELIPPVIQFSRANEPDKAREYYLKNGLPLVRTFAQPLDQLVQLNSEGADRAKASASASFGSTMTSVLAVVIGATILAVAMGLLIIRAISKGIASLTSPMGKLAAGDLSVAIPMRGDKTELGTMADAVQVFKDALITKKEADEAAALEADAKMRRAQRLDQITRSFETNVSALTQALSSAAAEMETTARNMTNIASETTNRSVTVASAAEQTSSNVQTVAAATEELSISIREIAQQVVQSSKIAERAVEDARRTNTSVQALANTAERIGNVVQLINTIAGQTNLLALNATIEAARAGEAGRGFAVVATEVKELASQTARATDEIGTQIGEVQTATREAVAAIQAIAQTIQEMSHISTSIAAAMEEQGAATGEISRNVQQAAKGTEQVTGNISDVRQGAGETGAAASQVLSAAKELALHSSDLSREVDTFLAGVKAA
jgi:methyl-accepting chemotaxis protein